MLDGVTDRSFTLHANAGRMDFFKFGNLTFARAGFSMHLLSDWYFGSEYFVFQKTKRHGPPCFLHTPTCSVTGKKKNNECPNT